MSLAFTSYELPSSKAIKGVVKIQATAWPDKTSLTADVEYFEHQFYLEGYGLAHKSEIFRLLADKLLEEGVFSEDEFKRYQINHYLLKDHFKNTGVLLIMTMERVLRKKDLL